MSYRKVITMCAWSRPHCLSKSLAALSKCRGIEDYTVIIHIDGPEVEGISRPIAQFTSSCSIVVIQNDFHCGCNKSTLHALAEGFKVSDYVIHVEEDVVLAPDALEFFEWAKRAAGVFSVGAWKHDLGDVERQTPVLARDDPRNWQVTTARNFHIWGWATWRHTFEWMVPRWSRESDQKLSWDTKISQDMKAAGCVELVPLVSRATNVGDAGIHRGRAMLNYWSGAPGFVSNEFAMNDVAQPL